MILNIKNMHMYALYLPVWDLRTSSLLLKLDPELLLFSLNTIVIRLERPRSWLALVDCVEDSDLMFVMMLLRRRSRFTEKRADVKISTV